MLNHNLEILLKNNLKEFSKKTHQEQRSVGDDLEEFTRKIIKKKYPEEFRPPKSKRSVDDFTLIFNHQEYCFDIKSHFIQKKTGFSMPNLISVKRLRDKIFNDNSKFLSYIFIDYTRDNDIVTIQNVQIKFIWELHWNILGIGALGKGQLQIKNKNNPLQYTKIGKQKWIEIFREKVREFYANEIIKIKKETEAWN